MLKFARLWMRFKNEIALAWAMLRNPAAPLSSKLLIVAALLYVISPFDLIPDIPLVGWLDDGLIAYLLLQLAARLLPAELLAVLRARVAERHTAARTMHS